MHTSVYLEKAAEYDVDAVYFRFFEGDRPPIPQVYIYDYTNKPLDQQAQTDIAQKQRRIWSSCQVPLFYVITKTNIQIFNSYEKPKFDAKANVEYKPYQLIDFLALASEINQHLLEDFSARSFDSGAFWEKESYRDDFLVQNSAYEYLIVELRHMRRNILPQTGLYSIRDRLVIIESLKT